MSLNWADGDDWRAPFYGRVPRRLPAGYESAMMRAVREAGRREDERDETMAREWAAHARQIRERDAAARRRAGDEVIRAAITRHGADAVFELGRRYDPTFELPAVEVVYPKEGSEL